MHCAPCIVFVGLRIAKIYDQPIPLVLRDMSVKAVHGLSTERLVVTRHLEQLFGIEGLGTLRHADESTHEHRQLAPLRLGGDRHSSTWCSHWVRRWWRGGWRH